MIGGLIPILLGAVPKLIGALAGDKAGAVVEAGARVAKEMLGTDDPAEIKARLESDPALAAAFAERLKAETAQFLAGIEDTQDAREHTIELVRQGSALAWGPVILSLLVVAGFLTVTGLLMFKTVTDSQVALVLFGTLCSAFTQVLNYWLGSSRGSAEKDAAIRGMLAPVAKAGKR